VAVDRVPFAPPADLIFFHSFSQEDGALGNAEYPNVAPTIQGNGNAQIVDGAFVEATGGGAGSIAYYDVGSSLTQERTVLRGVVELQDLQNGMGFCMGNSVHTCAQLIGSNNGNWAARGTLSIWVDGAVNVSSSTVTPVVGVPYYLELWMDGSDALLTLATGDFWSRGGSYLDSVTSTTVPVRDLGSEVSVSSGGNGGSNPRVLHFSVERPTNFAMPGWTRGVDLPSGVRASSFQVTYDSVRDVLIVQNPWDPNLPGRLDTWEYADGVWYDAETNNQPPGRSTGCLAYHEADDVTVLYGGWDGATRRSDTWLYDGVDWNEIFPSTPPPKRSETSCVYDTDRGVIVMYGGFDGGRHNDTWEYANGQWTNAMPATNPNEGHSSAAIAYDQKRKKTVIFGGYYANNSQRSDVWEYDGNGWVAGVAGPYGAYTSAMVYSEKYQTIVMHGGGGQGGVHYGTWLYDGSSWDRIYPDAGVTQGVTYVNMGYDSLDEEIYFLYGQDPSNPITDVWVLR
jgi:hypothetical protein